MHATFVLGPAGSGKTHRCVQEIRAALAQSADGPPLVLLAPKQATFQLERQLLADASLAGYTRLHILSFERLAEWIFDRLDKPLPPLLSEEGRVMVLRALLGRHQKELRVFRATARLPGFARQVNLLLRELQCHQLTVALLEQLSQRQEMPPRLTDKLHDLALVLRAYRDWLRTHQLEDADHLLDLATAALQEKSRQAETTAVASSIAAPPSLIEIEGLWLDGFAEMTPQELALLSEICRHCRKALLAFCLERLPAEEESWLSPWTVVSSTFRRCHAAISTRAENRLTVEALKRDGQRGRFVANPELAHLEAHWSRPEPLAALPTTPVRRALPAIRLVACPHPEGEATFAAHEILRFVREEGARFRDCAVLLRNLDSHHDTLRSVFTRYGIPFFLDRREPVAHHPLAELTRYALRTAAFGWRQEDWFGALKTGLAPASDSEIDRLENDALAHGWQGPVWQEPLPVPDKSGPAHPLEWIRQKLVPPFARFCASLAEKDLQPNGAQLAATVRALWQDLRVEEQLDRWSSAILSNFKSQISNSLHQTVWVQMNDWLENLERAFAGETMSLREWLAIVEAGLSGLTAGVVPPALDQVLVGAVDRSRNPDLRRVFVLGLNETLFPAQPPRPTLLTEAEREALALHGHAIGATRQQQLGHERYFGYMAATRAREQVVFTFSRRDTEGATLNPSVFVAHLTQLFPGLQTESMPARLDLTDSQHACEIVAPLLRNALSPAMPRVPSLAKLAKLPLFQPALAKAAQQAGAMQAGRISPVSAEKLYGTELAVSINRLEDFAECPFKFFVGRGLRAQERQLFEPDVRERGSFQHEILKDFHQLLRSRGQRWRDVMPTEAQVRIRQVGERLMTEFRDGLFAASATRRFQAEVLIAGLERLMGTVIDWIRQQYEFDPQAVEVAFGMEESPLAGWRVLLDGSHKLVLRGRIDRIDLLYLPEEDAALAVVIDYKSSEKKLDPTRLHHGLQLQLLGYLNTLRHLPDPRQYFGVARIIPAGVFYLNLKGSFRSGRTRVEVLEETAAALASAYQHLGRFNGAYLEHFDNTGRLRGDQFRYSKNKDGTFSKIGNEATSAEAFQELLAQAEAHVRRIGQEIYAGTIKADPFRIGNETACDYCEYRAICRFDPWVQPYRVLRPPPKEEEEKPAKTARRKKSAQ